MSIESQIQDLLGQEGRVYTAIVDNETWFLIYDGATGAIYDELGAIQLADRWTRELDRADLAERTGEPEETVQEIKGNAYTAACSVAQAYHQYQVSVAVMDALADDADLGIDQPLTWGW